MSIDCRKCKNYTPREQRKKIWNLKCNYTSIVAYPNYAVPPVKIEWLEDECKYYKE